MRLFIALDIPQEISENLRKIQQEIPGKIKLTDSFHLTLKFLGEVDEEKVSVIKERLENVEMERFDVIIKGIGVFPNQAFVKVVWAGLESEGKVKELQREVEKNLEGMGFRNDHKFRAHVTLARVKFMNAADKEKLLGVEVPEMKFRVKKIKLYKSELKPEGPEYTVLAEKALSR